jgi:23S rRNA pseudouridine1911/1915/1917 synthase
VPDVRSLEVPEGLEGERLDAGLARLFGFSRTRAAELVAEGAVHVDGAEAFKSMRLTAGARLVVYSDDDIVVVDKPVGVAAHPSPGWSGPTVIGGLAGAGFRVSTSGAAERQGVVHRLDVGTTGLMVVAKSENAYTVLKDAFRHRTVEKRYAAVVQGHPDPSTGTVDAPIGRHPRDDWRWAVVAGGRESVTHYETVEAFRAASLLDIELETGRTHQIRVHMSALKHPCVGDLTYGADPTLAQRLGLTRQWLHAARLSFDHPATGERVHFEAPPPADLAHALEVLRADGSAR